MLCKAGECIPLQLRCNRLADCRDSSDEKNCTCAQLLKAQLQGSKICDGIDDCADLSDETECGVLILKIKICILFLVMCRLSQGSMP